MVQRGGTVKMNVQNVTLLVCVATLVMVACVLFKTCVNEGFANPDSNNNNANKGVGGSGNGQGGRGNGNRPNNGHNHGNNYHNNGGSSEYSVSDCSGCTGTNFGSNNCPSECE
tara:strand:- start:694 stop:1032 length:339 start_codon:yes stop_codon:yes gene_type:complete